MSEFKSWLAREGVPLEALGIRDTGVPVDRALAGLRLLSSAGTPVLGGDVLRRFADRIELTHDNWYCERRAGETDAGFVERSISVARAYLENLIRRDVGEMLVTIVIPPDDKTPTRRSV